MDRYSEQDYCLSFYWAWFQLAKTVTFQSLEIRLHKDITLGVGHSTLYTRRFGNWSYYRHKMKLYTTYFVWPLNRDNLARKC